jgi:mono/diheme cytochrome c family protein
VTSYWRNARRSTAPVFWRKFVVASAGQNGPWFVACFLLMSLLLGAACSSQNPKPSESGSSGAAPSQPAGAGTNTADAQNQAKEIFATRCAACHGEDGRGDGPGAASLDPKPKNFHDPAWQKSVTDDEIEKAILLGGSAVGKSPLMVANPDLQSQPAVVAALRERIRHIGSEGK